MEVTSLDRSGATRAFEIRTDAAYGGELATIQRVVILPATLNTEVR